MSNDVTPPHQPPVQQTSSPPAAWYPDPSNPAAHRYWDGHAWTNQQAPMYASGTPVPPGRKIGFKEATRRGLSQWKNYSGRATIAEYWWYFLFEILIFLPVYVVIIIGLAVSTPRHSKATLTTAATTTGGSSALATLMLLLFLVVVVLLAIPRIALSVRRLHDTNRSGWYLLLGFVPFGSIVLLVFFCGPSHPGPNEYGAPVT